MRILYTVLFFCFFGISDALGQISVTATAATTGPTAYTTLKAAFDAINAGTHKGVITVNISGNTTETTTAELKNSGGTSSYTSVAINATANAVISSNLFGATITLNGADNVNLNGNNQLEIFNTHIQGQVVNIGNGATNNVLRNTHFRGSSNMPDILTGVIYFGTGTGNGNDGNTIDNCLLDGNNIANCLLYSAGTSPGFPANNNIFNSENTVKNCRFRNFVNPAMTSTAIRLSNSNNWTIENNSFYITAPLTLTGQIFIRGIHVTPTFTNDFHTVTGNFVGGTGPNATGIASITASGTDAIGMIAIDVQTAGTGNVVSNNTVSNMNLSYSSSAGSYVNDGIFSMINNFNGTTTVSGNSVTNINFTNSNGYIQFNPIHLHARLSTAGETLRPVFNVTNNTVSNITLGSGGGTGDVGLIAIRLESSSASSLASGLVNASFNVTGNTVSNLNSSFSGVLASYVRGISSTNAQGTSSTASLFPKVNISNNTIHTLNNGSAIGSFTAPSTYANYGSPVVVGISYGGSNGPTVNTTDTARINGNIVYNLNATNTGNNGVVATGILGSVGILEVTKNKVYGIMNAASGAGFSPAPGIIGINIRRTDGTANSIVANNFISVGSNGPSNVQIFGILNNFTGGTGPLQVFHNSIVVTGAGAAGNNKVTAAFQRGTETQGTGVTTPVDLRNNILYNSRTGGGSHYAVSNTSATPATGFTSDYNDLYTVNPATVALWNTTNMDLATYKTSSGDANSRTVAVTFVNEAAGDLHLAGASVTDANLRAVPAPNVTVDYDNDSRSATAPTIGADEGAAACVAPAITAQPVAQTVCNNTNAAFSVTATGTSLSYQWRKAGVNISGATSSTYTITGATSADAANYDVVINGACGSVTSSAVALTIKTATAINTQPVSQTLCAGSNVSFTVAGTGSGTLSYQWRKNGTNITGATSATYQINNITTADGATYDVVVTGECSTVTSATATLTVNTAPSISTQPANQTVCASGSATFTVTATGTGLTYQWQKNGSNITGATGSSYTINPATATDAANYTVIVSGTCTPAVTSSVATLTISGAPVINTQPASQTVCANAAASFTVAASGSGLTYQWRKGGASIAGATNVTYSIAATTAADAASYDVVVSAACGTPVTSTAATLTVNAVTAIGTQPTAQVVCAGAPANFTVAATGTNLTYQWRKSGVNIAGATLSNYSIAAVVAGDAANYDVVVSGTCGNVTSSSAALGIQTSGCATSLPVIDTDVESAVLMPNVATINTTLKLKVKRSMQIYWVITDANAREVRSFTSQATAGSNELTVYMQDLPTGMYYLNGRNSKGHVAFLKFVKQ